MSRQPVPRRPMTANEKSMARALGRCSFVPATQAKRFAAGISARAETKDPEISEGEAGYLRSCVYTFRRQIVPSIVAMAGDVPAERARRAAEASDRSVAPKTSIDPEMDDDATGSSRAPMPTDTETFDLFSDGHPENTPDEPRAPKITEPSDSEGAEAKPVGADFEEVVADIRNAREKREAKTVDRRSFLVAMIASIGAWFIPKRAVAQPIWKADRIPYDGVPYSAARVALQHEQELARRNGLMLQNAWRRKFAAELELAELRLSEARGAIVPLSSIGREESRR